MLDTVKNQLNQFYPQELVDSLLGSYKEVVESFNLGKLRPSEVEGGRFCEAAIRMLQYKTTGAYTPIGTRIANLDIEISTLANLPKADFSESIRLHIPRTIRVIYDIRSKRDSVHLGNISPNLMDATLILNCCKWVLAELFRMELKIPANEAQKTIDYLIEKKIPIIQDFDGFLVTLNPCLSARDRILVLLYYRGKEGATREELSLWLPPKMKKQLTINLSRLQYDKNFIHRAKSQIYITRAGEQFVEDNISPYLFQGRGSAVKRRAKPPLKSLPPINKGV